MKSVLKYILLGAYYYRVRVSHKSFLRCHSKTILTVLTRLERRSCYNAQTSASDLINSQNFNKFQTTFILQIGAVIWFPEEVNTG